jgi:twinkle protein
MINVSRLRIGNNKIICPECSHTRRNKSDPCLSVTLETDNSYVWNCHHCGFKGGHSDKTEWKPEPKKFYNKKIYAVPNPIEKKENMEKQYQEFFIKRKISKETLDHFNITTSKMKFNNQEKETAVFPYYHNGKLVNQKFRSIDKEFRQTKDAQRTLYNIDCLNLEENKNQPLIIVEGELDVLSLHECGYTKVVSLPDGAPKEAKFKKDDARFQALKVHAEELAKETNIIIATDYDEAGKALALEFAHRFGKDRCSSVDWGAIYLTGDVVCKDASDALTYGAKDTIKMFINGAKPYPVDGLYKANDYINQVIDLYHGKEEKPLTTGYKVLDTVYRLMEGTFTIVTGIPNHGKSNFLDQILINASKIHKWKFAIFSPEHSTPRHLTRLTEKYLELPFVEGATRKMSEEQLVEGMRYINNHFYFLESRDEKPTIKWILEKARVCVIREGLNGIVIDPYNEIDTNDRGTKREDEHIKDIISACKRFARTHNICVWIVAHPAKMHRNNDGTYPVPSMYDISGSAHWHNMADIGLCVHRNFEDNETVVYVKKVREQGLYGEIGECLFGYDVQTRSYREVINEETKVQIDTSNSWWND